MDNQFQILLKAVLDASGIGESDISRVQKVVDKYTVNLATELDTAKLLKTVKAVVPELEAELKKITGVDIKIDDKTILKTINQVVTETRKATAEQEKLTQAMAKGREQAELQAQAELKRQEIAQSNAANKAIEQEYSQRQKLTQSIDEQALKIRQMQSEGSIQLSFDKIEAQYNKLEKLGLVTDSLINNFAQLKQSFNSFDPSGKSENAVNDYTKLNLQLKSVKNSMSSIATTAPKVNKSILSIEKLKLTNQIDTWMRVNTKADQFNGRLEKIKADISVLDDMSGLPELRKQFQEVNSEADKLGLKGKSLSDKLWSGMKDFASWTFGSSMVMNAVHAVKDMWNGVISLDTALIDLKKTTDATESELKNFYYTSNDTAKQLGVTTAEIINATAAWSRLGYSIKDASILAKNSAILSSISPDLSIDEATDGLVSSLKAFKINAEDSLDGVISKINIIGNTQAVDNGDLVDILTRSSSAMAEANNTLEQTIALGTAATEITRDASSVGTALKTISMRIRGYDEETESYTEDLENLSGTIADLTKTVSSPGGISLFTDSSKETFKSTYDIIKDISKIYDELSDKNQAELLEALAGKRQGQIVAAMINNFSNAEKSMKSMANSTGNAMEEMNVIFESADYKLNRLKETGIGIGQNLINSDGMKASIDTVYAFARAIDFLTGKLGLFGTLSIGGGIAAFIKNLDWLKMQSYNKSCLDFLVGLV